MNCEEVRQHWHVFHDSEGDAELHLRINDHLSLCDDCAKWFVQQSRLEDGIIERLRDVDANGDMWSVIRQQCVASEPSSKRRLVAWSLIAAVLLVCLSLVSRRDENPERDSADLAELSASLHENLATGREPMTFVSDSTHAVEEFLRATVSFPVRCPPPEEIGFAIRGGGTYHFERDPVAYIVGEVEGTTVSVFVMDRNSLSHFPSHSKLVGQSSVYECREQGVDIVMSQVNDNLVLVTGRTTVDQLRQLLKAYGSHSSDHG